VFRRFSSGRVSGVGGVIVMSGWGGWGISFFLSSIRCVERMYDSCCCWCDGDGGGGGGGDVRG